MNRLLRWVRRLIRELRRRRVIRVAALYAGTAFVVLQLGEILVEPFGLPGWTLRMVTFLLVLGFPLAVGLAWVYNLTEEGVVREVGVETAEEQAASPGSPFTSNGLIVGLLIVAIGLLLYPRMFSSGEGPSDQGSPTAPDTAEVEERSIAVLPFEALGKKEPGVFTEGIHDGLLTRLANISDLTVISRTSVERYRDTDLPLPAIADSLGVRWVMEGGVQKAGDQIQVNAQLINPRTDGHVWAEDYRRTLTAENLFAIQGEITREIADALKAKLTAGEQKRIAGAPTENLQAYRLYVQGRRLLASRESDSIRRAQRYFERALSRDSTYALAWAGLADAHMLYDLFAQTSSEKTKSLLEKARAAARRAVRLDPNLAEAHAALGAIQVYEHRAGLDRGDGPAALRTLRRAVNLKPSSANAQQWLGELYLHLGRPKRGLKHTSLAVELNPRHRGARTVLIWALLANGQAEKAWRHVRRVPKGLRGGFEGTLLYHTEQWDKLGRLARKKLKGEATFSPLWRFYLARVAVLRGDTASAQKQLAKISQQEAPMAPFAEGLIHAALGEREKAFAAWERVETWPGFFVNPRYLHSDILDPLRKDPRYEKLIREINQRWGLNPDGTIPETTEASTGPKTDA